MCTKSDIRSIIVAKASSIVKSSRNNKHFLSKIDLSYELLLRLFLINNRVFSFTNLFIFFEHLFDIFLISNKCNDLIHKYNKLQNEKKEMIKEYDGMKKDNNISKDQKQDFEDRILDLSFQIDDVHQRWVKCNGGVSTNILP